MDNMDNGQLKVFELWLGNDLISYTYEEIKSNPKLEQDLKKLQRMKAENELQFFVPHGAARFANDCGFMLASSADWVNDRKHFICICCSPNQVGKTCHGVVKKVLRLIKCDPNWQIFKNGIEYHEWNGPKTLVVLGYDKGHLERVLWPELQKWIPAKELGPYCHVSLGGTKEPSWKMTPDVTLQNGSKIILLTYDQKASVCAGVKAEEVLADEQIPLPFFNELDQRGRTRGGIWWDFSFTPHKVQGRADTGANSWLIDMWTGHNTRGHDVLRCRISIDDVPDRIFSKEQKRKAYLEHVEIPKKVGDRLGMLEGAARYYGIFQQSSGLFYPEIQRELHFIPWTYESISDKGWTHFRCVDYGWSNPTACSFWAISPTGDYFMYDEYYISGKDAYEHAPGIIEKSGNKRKLIKKIIDNDSGAQYDVYEEEEIRQKYMGTFLDWHCFQMTGGIGRPLSFFFQIGGLRVSESTKLNQEHRAQNLRALLKIDPNRNHIVTGKPGAPRMYFSTKCAKFKWEWERCVTASRSFGNETNNYKETKRNKDDHLIDTAEYMASSEARYLGDYLKRKPKTFQNISSHGGY
jgi:hypothetical protein